VSNCLVSNSFPLVCKRVRDRAFLVRGVLFIRGGHLKKTPSFHRSECDAQHKTVHYLSVVAESSNRGTGFQFLGQTHAVAFGSAKKAPWQQFSKRRRRKITETALAPLARNFPWRPKAIHNCV